MSARRRTVVTAASIVAACLALATAAPSPAGEEEKPASPSGAENLKVLPHDITRPELIEVMKGFTRGLGVRCQHCHVGEEGMPLDEFDFASDEKEMKRQARVMLEMVQAINTSYLPRVEEGARVSCLTCHHGNLHPETLEDALFGVYEQAGAEAAVGRYRQLREEHYGGWVYDFGERSLLRLAEKVAAAGDGAGAKAIVELNLEHHPSSAFSWFTLGELENAAGNPEAAAAAYLRTLETDPEFGPARTRLEELKATGEQDG